MSDENTVPQGAATTTTVPATQPVVTPAQPPATAPAPAPEPQRPADEQSPAWLPERLKQARGAERNAMLRELGVESPDEIKARLARLAELEAAQLTEQERQLKALEEAKAQAQRAAQYEKPFTEWVTKRFESLTPEQQAVIDARAKGDPVMRHEGLSYLDALATSTPAPAPAPVAPPAPPRPADTAPEAPKPPPASGGAPKTKYEEWVALRDHPGTSLRASLFYQANRFEIDRSRPQT